MQSAVNKLEVERAELDAILASEMLGRANNLVRLLSFVCEKYFDGAIDEIKEYSIAVQALGRSADFDPQVDTIVRVTAHALRKRLEEYYRNLGADHAVHISLPPGHYVPKFIHRDEPDTRADLPNGHRGHNGGSIQESAVLEAQRQEAVQPSGVAIPDNSHLSRDRRTNTHFVFPSSFFVMVTAVVVAAVALSAFIWLARSRSKSLARHDVTAAPVVASISGPIIRAVAGESRAAYVDRAGATWESDRFCTGGNSFSIRDHVIQGTEDASLFSAGRRGVFRCSYPVPPGTYEVHLLFAETAGLLENSRNVAFSINGGPIANLDVVDDSGGDDIATTKVLTDVKPGNDGAIHLDFTTPDSFLNAIEILPGIPHRMLPIRIITGPSLYRDSQGNTWLPDRYFFGGRVNRLANDLSRMPEGRLFEWHRYGHFHYTVPVASDGHYTLKLYFLEHWFGEQNGGGAGSRVFDVSCNGSMLLKNFDIFGEAGLAPLTKTFTHIEPTPQGKIEIYFTPGLNYPSVSAFEILAE